MPLFYFILKAGRDTFPDTDGEEFDDESGAREHAHAVACELMRNRETETCHWCMEVCDDYLQPVYECRFADIDQTHNRYGGNLSVFVTAVARTTAAINEAVSNIDAELADLRVTLEALDNVTSRFSQGGNLKSSS